MMRGNTIVSGVTTWESHETFQEQLAAKTSPYNFACYHNATADRPTPKFNSTGKDWLYILRSVQNTGTFYSGQDRFVRNLAQVYLTNPAEAWVACLGIVHISWFVL